MKKLNSFTTNGAAFTGQTAKDDFRKYGKIDLSFYVHEDRIGVEVAGFDAGRVYLKNPKNVKEKFANAYFYDRYVRHAFHKNDIDQILKKWTA